MTPATDLRAGGMIRVTYGIGLVDLVVDAVPQSDGWVHLRWGWGPGDTRFVPADSRFMVVGKFEPKILL